MAQAAARGNRVRWRNLATPDMERSMNLDPALLLAALFFAAAVVAIFWALMERGRADKAEARVYGLQDAAARVKVLEEMGAKTAALLQGEAVTAIAEQVLKRADETFHNREQLAQARLEAQLKPVAETLAAAQRAANAAAQR